MGCLLKLITVMLLAIGGISWVFFFAQLFKKIVHPNQKNLRGEEFFLVGLMLLFLTVISYLGFRKRSLRNTPDGE